MRRTPFPRLALPLAAVVVLAANPCEARQLPLPSTLLADINLAPSPTLNDSDPGALGEVGGLLYLRATGSVAGSGPWVTDGTAAGTIALNDVGPGPDWTHPYDSVVLSGGRVLMSASTPAHGNELAIAGPGIQGVQLLVDIWPGPDLGFSIGSSGPVFLTEWNGEAWFFANDGLHGIEVWRSDGTAAGTVLAHEIVPGPGGMSNGTNRILVAGGKLYFTTTYPDRALYVLPTPTSAPVKLATIATSSSYFSVQLAEAAGGLFFTADTAAEGLELWRTDGTAAGTALVLDIWPGFVDGDPDFLHGDATRLWFSASSPGIGEELWTSDGTAGGTVLVKDISPGFSSGVFISWAIPLGADLLFSANNGALGTELWRSDGTAAGTVLVADVEPGAGSSYPAQFFELGGIVCFDADDGVRGYELWRTDGTTAGTRLVADLNPGPDSSYPYPLGPTAAGYLIGASDGSHGYEPYLTDGTSAGTALLVNLYPDPLSKGGFPDQLRSFRSLTLFRAQTELEGNEPWFTDGTAGGTQLLADLKPGSSGSNPVYLAELSAGLLFTAITIGTGQELWITDATASGTQLVKHIDNGYAASGIGSAQVLGDRAYFVAREAVGYRLWSSDGTAAGTLPVAGAPELQYQYFEADAVLGGEFLFRANDDNVTGQELWKSNGTGAGTVQVKDINPGSAHSLPGSFTPLGGKLVFVAETAAEGQELWITDGTTAGTVLIADIRPGADSSKPWNLTRLGSSIVFAANDGANGGELWITDGTTAGTLMLADIAPGPADSFPTYLERSGDAVFFWANDGQGGRALWKTDGTTAGTVLVSAGPVPGVPFAAEPLAAVGSGEVVAFLADDGIHGREPWVSDGTAAGTQLLSDVAPGLEASWPHGWHRTGGSLLFSADDLYHGWELHAAPLGALDTWVAEPYGVGCGGAVIDFSGQAVLGASLSVDTTTPAPFAPAALFFSSASAYTPLGSGCAQLIGTPQFLTSAVADASGLAQHPVTVPANPSLVGKAVFLQYASFYVGAPLLGVMALSDALELVVGM